MNRVCISTGSLPRLEGKQFYELSSVVRVMKRLLDESKVDGFEFVLLPEWDSENPPLSPSDAPKECEKHTVQEVLDALETRNFPILSVHANRDIGNYLCHEDTEKVEKGIRIMRECLDFTREVGSRVCVFHFWDTWKEVFDLSFLEATYQKFQNMYPEVELSVENISTRYMGKTPFQIMKNFRFKTLDLKWASLFDEFDAFVDIIWQVDNVHVQGRCQDGMLVPSVGSLDYEKAIRRIKEAGYCGIFTVELEGKTCYDDVLVYVEKLRKDVGIE